MVRHKTGTWAKDGDVRTTLFHFGELVGLYGFAQFVVADFEVAGFGHHRRVFDACDLAVTPIF